ncbi:MAG: SPOR domain-containing protein [Muribaculaceae bacterium]|nr:SPOR domain-containing protein [Muribaculaceae bacterium]MDE6643999.1 SPOR domain-containing protein [Muribaculaceae bacterium]
MKNTIYSIIAISLICSTFTSCKTSEKNYRAAYELAQQKKTESDGETDNLIKKEEGPQSTLIDGVVLPVKSVYTSPVRDIEGFDPADVKKYNVVIASFRQLFNAKSVRKRAITAGFDKAYILVDRDKVYYVVAQSYSTAAEAEAALKKVTKAEPVVMKSPYPYILRRP